MSAGGTGATGAAESRGTPGGTVFDIGYQRYTGTREGRRRGRLAVYKDGVRIALGLGRGGRAKILPWGFILILSSIAMVMALVAGAVARLDSPEAAAQLPSHGDFYGIASIVLFVFAAVVAPEMLCRDRRERTLSLYLVRPLTGTDYIVSRWAAFLTVVVATAWLPQVILLTGLSMGAPDPLAYLRAHWVDIPAFLAAGVAMAVYTTTLALLTASFTTRRAYASVFLVGLFVITTPFTTGLAMQIGGTVGQWISMFNLSNIPVHVNDLIFGEPSMITRDAPAGQLPGWVLAGWYVLWTLVPGGVLWARYRRMTA
jgi:ABC-2 type transport system permease protein